jgi:hypothetical protein
MHAPRHDSPHRTTGSGSPNRSTPPKSSPARTLGDRGAAGVLVSRRVGDSVVGRSIRGR